MPEVPGYLIRYGRPGFVGRFTSALSLARGDRVVVRGPRGIELGEVLVAPECFDGPDDGAILRSATPRDDTEAADLDARVRDLLAAAETRGGELGLSIAFVDVEATLDGTAILHALAWGACDATALLDELAAESSLTVRLLDLAHAPAAKDPTTAGCGKPGCGSENGSGGCSTCGGSGGCASGSCARGSVKSPAELTAYFADLRRQMEAAGIARTPLN